MGFFVIIEYILYNWNKFNNVKINDYKKIYNGIKETEKGC